MPWVWSPWSCLLGYRGGEGQRQNGRTERAEPVRHGEGHGRPVPPVIGCWTSRGGAGPRVKVTFGRVTKRSDASHVPSILGSFAVNENVNDSAEGVTVGGGEMINCTALSS